MTCKGVFEEDYHPLDVDSVCSQEESQRKTVVSLSTNHTPVRYRERVQQFLKTKWTHFTSSQNARL